MSQKSMTLYGIHAVKAALGNRNRKCHKIYVTRNTLDDIQEVLDFDRHPEPQILSGHEITAKCGENSVHQGLAAEFSPLQTPPFEKWALDLVMSGEEPITLVVLDQVTDPHNVGAIMRSAAAFGAKGVIMPERGSCPVTATLAKTAVGALEHIPLFYVRNLSEALDYLQKQSYYRIGLDEGGQPVEEINPGQYPCRALVMGAEGKGLREKTRKYCDAIWSLPTSGPIQALNVSVAAGTALYALKVS